MNLFDIFDHTYIINLPDRKDRRKETISEIQFLNGDLNKGNIEFFNAIKPDVKDGWPTVGSRGSLLSHMAALKKIIRFHRESGAVLLLEDDVAFSKMLNDQNTLALIKNAITQHDWDFLYLGHDLKQTISQESVKIEYYDKPILLAHCLAFHTRNLPRLIDYLEQTCERPEGHPEGGRFGFDPAINHYRKLFSTRTLVVFPCLAYQRPSRTDLGLEKWFDRVLILRHIAKFLRMLRTAHARKKRKI